MYDDVEISRQKLQVFGGKTDIVLKHVTVYRHGFFGNILIKLGS